MASAHRVIQLLRRKRSALAARVRDCPAATGVYRLYRAKRLLHIGMAAGAATLRSEVLAHARGDYGAATRQADCVEWEVAPNAQFAYRRFIALYNKCRAPSSSKRSAR